MDACIYCRKYHKPFEVCDGYIEKLEKGEVIVDDSNFLYIFEDGDVGKGSEPTKCDLACADDGVLTLINIEDMTTYFDGKWVPLQRMTLQSSDDVEYHAL